MGRTETIRRALAVVVLVGTAMGLATLVVGAQQPPSGEPLFLTAFVDSDQPYIGQQVTYVSKIYQRADFARSLQYEPPGFAGFWNPRATEQSEHNETIDAKDYRVIELRTILFPSVVETIEIGPGVLTAVASPSEDATVVESVPILVDVHPLPTGAPAGFTGAVGRFQISAEVDTTTVRVNESVQLMVKIEGSGNIDALPDPHWPEFRGWRVIESPGTANSEIIDGKLVGSRTYESVLVPEMTAELTVPSISYTYFDPDLEQYAQTTTSQVPISVAAVDGVPSVPPPVVGTEDDRILQGARDIKPVPLSVRESGREITDSVLYWAVWCFPLLAIAGAMVWRRRRDAWEAALADSRRRNALPNARSTLARAVAEGDDHTIAAAGAVLSYLSDRFGEPLNGLTRVALGQQLVDSGVPAEVVERVEQTLASGEAARYTPRAQSADQDRIERATQLLIELDGAIGP